MLLVPIDSGANGKKDLDPANYPAVTEEAEQVGKGAKGAKESSATVNNPSFPLLGLAGMKAAGAQWLLIKWQAKSLSKGILLLRASSPGEILIDFELHW